jgi:hypothetical protein
MPRGSDEVDPVSGLGTDDLCWCRSRLSHIACHGDPLPPSDPCGGQHTSWQERAGGQTR